MDEEEDGEESEPVQQLDTIVAEAMPSEEAASTEQSSKRKRKKKQEGEEVEDAYMRRLAREEAKDAEAVREERKKTRIDQQEAAEVAVEGEEAASDEEVDGVQIEHASDDDDLAPPPRHETEQAADNELDKAKRTVFLGNVSTTAISSKASRKLLLNHLKSIFENAPEPKEGAAKHNLESIRFRSAPYTTTLPKKAAFAKKEVMDATTKSTNAYAVYSSPVLVREAVKNLNGSVVLDRHLRVDSVAHPAAVDHRRCVFVGNLGFVDDESNIQDANEEDGREKRKRSKIPADVEEGLWRTFAKCGKIESVRVVRDSATRVGKGIAYVQFEDGMAVEAALGLNEKKFPPMLPRKLRVSRAKAIKRNVKPRATESTDRPSATGYRRKITGEEASQVGRAGKLYGKAAAAQIRRPTARRDVRAPSGGAELPNGIRKPESFVFEGHRASSKSGKSGLKLGKKKGGKPTSRSAKRGAAYKADGKRRAPSKH